MKLKYYQTNHNATTVKLVAVISICLSLHVTVWAGLKTHTEAKRMVEGWLRLSTNPLQEDMGRDITKVDTYSNKEGEPLYHVVSLKPSGFVITSTDDEIEPIVAFADDGVYEFSEYNPLFTLITQDLQVRLQNTIEVRERHLLYSSHQNPYSHSESQLKWKHLESNTPGLLYNSASQGPLLSVSSMRVEPLLKTRWDQRTVNGNAYFNYFTPQWYEEQIILTPGDPNNYPSGCVATAIAQILKYHQYPTQALPQSQYPITIFQDDGIEKQYSTVTLLGGDLQGGPYRWDLMPTVLSDDATEDQRQAVGALCADAGAAVHMAYGPFASEASIGSIAPALRDTFLYRNAILGIHLDDGYLFELFPDLEAMVNPNLDAGYPVILCVYEVFEGHQQSGHAIVTDGYGYDFSTRYYHLNMGWSGNDDAWYNLPMVNNFNFIAACIYNVFPEHQGEIISGRTTDAMGDPIDDVLVTLTCDGDTTIMTTKENGIYAFASLLPETTYHISASKSGYTFIPDKNVVTTGKSISYQIKCGNIWAVNFELNDLN